jgi:hypothetical protein
MNMSRRDVLAAGGKAAMIAMTGAPRASRAQSPSAPDLIVHNANVTTLQRDGHEAQAFAARGEKIVAVGGEAGIMGLLGANTRVVDAGGRRVVPGLNDDHFHIVRGGRDYNLELRWDGVESLQRGLQMIQEQAMRTAVRSAATRCDGSPSNGEIECHERGGSRHSPLLRSLISSECRHRGPRRGYRRQGLGGDPPGSQP